MEDNNSFILPHPSSQKGNTHSSHVHIYTYIFVCLFVFVLFMYASKNITRFRFHVS